MVLGLTGHVMVLRRVPESRQWIITVGAGAGIIAVALWIDHALDTVRTQPPFGVLGIYALVPYRPVYLLAGIGWVVVAASSLLLAGRGSGLRGIFRHHGAHATALAMLAYLALPTGMHVPGHAAWFTFISQRVELVFGISLLAWVASVKPGRATFVAGCLVGILYFVPLASDHHLIAQHDTLLREAVRSAPEGSRVVFPYRAHGYAIDPLRTALDRACLGHCFSYAHYTPSTRHFRLRAETPNPYVIAPYSRLAGFHRRELIVREFDPPLLVVTLGERGYELRSMEEGDRVVREYVQLRP